MERRKRMFGRRKVPTRMAELVKIASDTTYTSDRGFLAL